MCNPIFGSKFAVGCVLTATIINFTNIVSVVNTGLLLSAVYILADMSKSFKMQRKQLVDIAGARANLPSFSQGAASKETGGESAEDIRQIHKMMSELMLRATLHEENNRRIEAKVDKMILKFETLIQEGRSRLPPQASAPLYPRIPPQ